MSSNDIAISVRGLCKQYTIAHEEKHTTLGEKWMSKLRSPLSVFRSAPKETFHALTDVSFDVKKGEVVGIIGRNGAGKSTLLKILSRITEPTSGEIKLYGRVASLLEVGTGFHPELTGRENIYLNGAILGMKRAEIRKRFDEIVAFAEVEKFLDTPVKRYSSGMYVRLAFAVAAHLEPEILIVDEVLAVGDAEFQKKCLGKMKDVAAGEGRTVLFVSHNMAAVADLCARVVWLSQGAVLHDDTTSAVIPGYLSREAAASEVDLTNWSVDRTGDGPLRLARLCTLNDDARPASRFQYGSPIHFELDVAGTTGQECVVGISIRDTWGHVILHFSNLDERTPLPLDGALTTLRITVANLILNDGQYFVTVWLGDRANLLNDRVGNCLKFDVDSRSRGTFRSLGAVRVPSTWRVLEPTPQAPH